MALQLEQASVALVHDNTDFDGMDLLCTCATTDTWRLYTIGLVCPLLETRSKDTLRMLASLAISGHRSIVG